MYHEVRGELQDFPRAGVQTIQVCSADRMAHPHRRGKASHSWRAQIAPSATGRPHFGHRDACGRGSYTSDKACASNAGDWRKIRLSEGREGQEQVRNTQPEPDKAGWPEITPWLRRRIEVLAFLRLLVEHFRYGRHILRYNVGRRLVLAFVPGSAARCGEGGAISDGIRQEGL